MASYVSPVAQPPSVYSYIQGHLTVSSVAFWCPKNKSQFPATTVAPFLALPPALRPQLLQSLLSLSPPRHSTIQCMVFQVWLFHLKKSYIYLFVFVYVFSHMPAHMWGSEDNLQELVLSFYCVDPRDWAQVVRHGGEHLCPLLCDKTFDTRVYSP